MILLYIYKDNTLKDNILNKIQNNILIYLNFLMT